MKTQKIKSTTLGVVMVIITLVMVLFTQSVQAQEYKVITVIESFIPKGLGRSRIIEYTGNNLSVEDYTTEREEGAKRDQGDIKRSDLKVDKFKETKLLNFYNFGGINFRNIASNDALVSSKINALVKEGWELVFVNTGAGVEPKQEFFLTRYTFKKN